MLRAKRRRGLLERFRFLRFGCELFVCSLEVPRLKPALNPQGSEDSAVRCRLRRSALLAELGCSNAAPLLRNRFNGLCARRRLSSLAGLPAWLPSKCRREWSWREPRGRRRILRTTADLDQLGSRR